MVLLLVMNFVNQIVVGALGATAIAAVGFANSLLSIPLAIWAGPLLALTGALRRRSAIRCGPWR
jgi:Na+-driven multidrug efflux pump